MSFLFYFITLTLYSIQVNYMASPRYIKQNLELGLFMVDKHRDYLLADYQMIIRHRLAIVIA